MTNASQLIQLLIELLRISAFQVVYFADAQLPKIKGAGFSNRRNALEFQERCLFLRDHSVKSIYAGPKSTGVNLKSDRYDQGCIFKIHFTRQW